MAKRIDPLNAEQLRRVMQTIASRADVARTLLIYAGTDTDELGRAVEASIALLTNIGAMADENADYPFSAMRPNGNSVRPSLTLGRRASWVALSTVLFEDRR